MNGIGGSGDFARNAYISFFMTRPRRRRARSRASSDGHPRRPHRARRPRPRDRAGARGPARPLAEAEAERVIEKCATRFPSRAPRLRPKGQCRSRESTPRTSSTRPSPGTEPPPNRDHENGLRAPTRAGCTGARFSRGSRAPDHRFTGSPEKGASPRDGSRRLCLRAADPLRRAARSARVARGLARLWLAQTALAFPERLAARASGSPPCSEVGSRDPTPCSAAQPTAIQESLLGV